jgi:hypothetical protein
MLKDLSAIDNSFLVFYAVFLMKFTESDEDPEEYYKKAVSQCKKENPYPYLAYARFLLLKGRNTEALELFQLIASEANNDFDVQIGIAIFADTYLKDKSYIENVVEIIAQKRLQLPQPIINSIRNFINFKSDTTTYLRVLVTDKLPVGHICARMIYGYPCRCKKSHKSLVSILKSPQPFVELYGDFIPSFHKAVKRDLGMAQSEDSIDLKSIDEDDMPPPMNPILSTRLDHVVSMDGLNVDELLKLK